MKKCQQNAAFVGGVCLLALACFAQPALAGPSYQVPLGPRALAMGGAFSAVADDATAIFWNPAGLSQIGSQEVMVTQADLYGIGIQDNFVAFALPVTMNQTAAVGWYRSAFDDDELGFGENRFDLSYAVRARSWLSVGGTVKYLTRATDLDGVDVASGSGRGLDLGLMATPWKGLRLGLVAQDVFDTEIKFDEGSSVAFPRNTRLAASYAFGSRGVVAVDIDDRYHLGGELRLFDMLALRTGLEMDREGSEDPQYSFGAGFELGVLRLDYAYIDHPVLEATNHFGLSLAFNFNPPRVRIEEMETREIYASLYKSYVDRPIGSVVLRNLEERALPTRVTVFIPGVMDSPTEQQVLLRPKAVQEIPITAVLSDRVAHGGGDRPIQVQVQVSYQSKRLPRTEKRSEKSVCYGPGAINWGLGLEQAAAFVTPRDAAVDALAREAVRSLDQDVVKDLPSRNIRYAAAIFNAVGVVGVSYVPDPHNPYSAMSETPRAVDTIHYPRETLESRGGDCDDTSVLMASLLANVGVRTQMVDVPGHVFLLLDTGIHERNRLAMGMDENLYVVSGDAIWIPLETTALGKGFAEAWRLGAEEYWSWSGRDRLALVDVSTAQRLYASAEFADPPTIVALDEELVRGHVSEDAEVVRGWREEYVAARYEHVREDLAVSPSASNQLAHIYYLGGSIEKARETLEVVLEADPNSALAHNNIAVAYTAAGDYEAALQHCMAAVDSEPDDPGIWLNLGILRYASGEAGGAESALSEGLARCDGFEDACRLLGLQVADDSSRAAAAALTSEEVRALLREVLLQLPAPEIAVGETVAPSAEPEVLEPPRPIRLRVAAARAEERMELADHLYWKQEERR